MKTWNVSQIAQSTSVETRTVLKRLPAAHAALAELKGMATTMPNQQILINSLILREAKDSSEVENIVTSHDDLYKSELDLRGFHSLAAKEVQNYVEAMKLGYDLVQKNKMLSNNVIKKIQAELEENDAGFRKQAGTVFKNQATQEVVYTPPQHPDDIVDLMSKLERYINNEHADIDPLVQMAIIHHQFESIHPYYDGNGRTGRIINILFLILKELQDLPILYLSQYIFEHKRDYYRLLQEVRETSQWEDWILFIIEGVEQTAREAISLINKIKSLMQEYKIRLRENYKFYSQDLINNLFRHPYTKIDFIVQDLRVSRITAANYLNQLANDGLLIKNQYGRTNYYINHKLYAILSRR